MWQALRGLFLPVRTWLPIMPLRHMLRAFQGLLHVSFDRATAMCMWGACAISAEGDFRRILRQLCHRPDDEAQNGHSAYSQDEACYNLWQISATIFVYKDCFTSAKEKMAH